MEPPELGPWREWLGPMVGSGRGWLGPGLVPALGPGLARLSQRRPTRSDWIMRHASWCRWRVRGGVTAGVTALVGGTAPGEPILKH